MGPPAARTKVRPLNAEPAMHRRYDPGAGKHDDEDPWQDPGGPEPGNG